MTTTAPTRRLSASGASSVDGTGFVADLLTKPNGIVGQRARILSEMILGGWSAPSPRGDGATPSAPRSKRPQPTPCSP